MKDKFLISMVAGILIFTAGCKPTEKMGNRTNNTTITGNSTLPVEFLEESAGLSTEEVQVIYALASEKARLICDKTEVEINTHSHNADQQKKKNNLLEAQIYELQKEIDTYLGSDNRRIQSFREAYRIETGKCRWAKEAGY